MFVSDFNVVLGAHEKRGKRLPPSISCMDFMSWTNANLLLHLDTVGVHLTWCNGRLNNETVSLRLDRDICNEAWTDFWQITTCDALVRHMSNHHPLLMSMEFFMVIRRSSFKNF